MDETLRDLQDDLTELYELVIGAHTKLVAYEHRLDSSRAVFYSPTFSYLKTTSAALKEQCASVRDDIQKLLNTVEQWTTEDVPRLCEAKKQYADLVRVFYSTLGSVLSADLWQSPSFVHSAMSQAGRETGSIGASENDYKRDLHAEEKKYSNLFVQEYIDHSMRFSPVAYATNSGMAAVTTVLTHLVKTVEPQDVVLAGKSSYFQNKWALEHIFPGKVVYVDEFDTEQIIELARTRRPALVFLDSLCGAEALPVPNLSVLLRSLVEVLPSRATIVLDNTGLGVLYQPLNDVPLRANGPRLLVVESLIKYHQFGFDRVNAGIVWAPKFAERGLFQARMHLGTIIPEASVLSLPTPNRVLLEKRMRRVGRNAFYLAQTLDARLVDKQSSISHVVYPGLPSYSGYAWTKDLPFQGGFIVLSFKEKYKNVKRYDAFIQSVLMHAKKAGVDLIGGTSFGFNTTRVYVTARYATDITEPFVRISAGTETRQEIEAVAQVLVRAIDDVSSAS